MLKVIQETPKKYFSNRAVVVDQLVEWSPQTPEIRDSNPVMGIIYLPSTVLKPH